MRWIHSPWWDGFWILSGIPLGGILASGAVPLATVFSIYLGLNSAHLVSPVAMGWSHKGFRQIMLARKAKYILVPLSIILAGAIIGATAGKTFELSQVTLALKAPYSEAWGSPFVMMLLIYMVWNAYHFGMQNYGVLRLYWRDCDRASAMQLAMFATLFAMVILPDLMRSPRFGMFCFGLVVINHQLTAIGLSSHVWANHYGRSPLWFAGALVMVGSLMAWLLMDALSAALMIVVGIRAAAGFVHFLYDRWVWRLSDPQVRATIGRDLGFIVKKA